MAPNRRSAFALLVLCPYLALGSAPVNASVVSAQQYLDIVHREAQMARIDVGLARVGVRKQLEALGVSHADAMARVEALTDEELVLLADRLEELPAGGGVLEVALAVGIVLLILELLNVIDLV
jgi:hypothetical protein